MAGENRNRNRQILSTAFLPLIALAFLVMASRGVFLARDTAPLIFAVVVTVSGLASLLTRRQVAFRIRLVCVVVASFLGFLSLVAHNHYRTGLNLERERVAKEGLLVRPAPPLNFSHALNVPVAVERPAFDFEDHLTLIDFWATWCSPCVDQMPRLDEMYRTYSGRGLQVLGFTRLYSEGEAGAELQEITDFVARLNVTYPILIAEADTVHRSYFVSALPTAVLVDEKGVVIDYAVSRDGTEELLQRIEQRLSGS